MMWEYMKRLIVTAQDILIVVIVNQMVVGCRKWVLNILELFHIGQSVGGKNITILDYMIGINQ